MELNKIKEYLNNAKQIDLEGNKISSMVNDMEKKYPEEKDFYIEVAKYYLDKDIKESIKYLEKYVIKGGDNEEVKLLLVKLYKQDEQLKKARELIKSLKKTEEVEVESLRIAIEIKDKEWIKEIDKEIKDKDIEIGEKEIEELCRFYEEDKEYDRERYYIERYKDKYKLPDIKYKYYERQGLVEQALKELIKDIDIENNKKEIVRIINENIEGYIKEATDIKWIIEEICKLIEEDDTSSETIQTLSLILRTREIKGKQREEIVELLMRYHEKSKKARAGNIFLNESEILEKKIILKSKPRYLTVSITTKCNLKCVICGQQYQPKYVLDNRCIDFIKGNMKYIEKIRWQGGEVIIYDNMKELIELACKHSIKQYIITNGLFLQHRDMIDLVLKNDSNIHLSISIDAIDQETYEKIRVGANFSVLIKNLEIFRLYKPINKMIVVVMKLNYKQISKMIEFAKFYHFKTIKFQRYIFETNLKNDLSLNNNQILEVIDEIKFYKNKLEKEKSLLEIETNISIAYDNIVDKKASNINAYDIQSNKQNRINNIEFNNENLINSQKGKNIQNDICGDNSLKITDKNNNSIDKKNIEINVNDYKDYKLFCVAPWTTICFFDNSQVRFSCNSNGTVLQNDDLDKQNIWNNLWLTEYRRSIIIKDLRVCADVCKKLAFSGEQTLLGFW